MSDDNKRRPRSLNSFKDHKLTRRRVVKAASAIGFSTPVAMNMTVDDVKASDSDQVTVSLDIGGNSKHTVAADRIEWLQKARKANKNLQNKFMGREGIISIGMSGGGRKDNPHVKVTLDEDNRESDERRGEIPEEENGVRVEVSEGEHNGETNACTSNCWPQSYDFPGGQEITGQGVYHGFCTSSSQMFDDGLNWFGWTTAAHCFDGCGPEGVTVAHTGDECTDSYAIGEGSGVDQWRDIAFIYDRWENPSYENIKPSDYSEGVVIIDTISREGFGVIDQEYGDTAAIFQYGIGSCFNNFSLRTWDETIDNSDYPCRSYQVDQMVLEHADFGGTTNDGDSGALYFVEDPNSSGDYYAMGSHTGYVFAPDIRHHGPQGYSIYNNYDRRWRS